MAQASGFEPTPLPDVGTGAGYGAVDHDQAEQERKTGCSGWAKSNPSKVILIVLGLAAAGVGAYFLFTNMQEEDTEWNQFKEWQVRFSKSYATDSERQERFQAFKESLIQIRHYNLLEKLNPSGGATFGLNKFSDLTPQEFQDQYLGLDQSSVASQLRNQAPVPTLKGASPSSNAVNWTDSGIVTPVRNQGSCGSCWAFACVGTVESVYLKNELNNGGVTTEVDDFHLSVQQMVSCDSKNYGCMGGWPIDAFNYVQQAGGLAHEDSYPYKGQTGSCDENQLQDTLVSGTQPTEIEYGAYCGNYGTWGCSDQDEEALAASVETYGPHVVCVNASPWQYYTGGVLSADVCNTDYGNGRRVLNHAVILTGYDMSGGQEGNYWSIKNSWSTSWGDNGYIHLEMGQNTCGVMNDALYVEL